MLVILNSYILIIDAEDITVTLVVKGNPHKLRIPVTRKPNGLNYKDQVAKYYEEGNFYRNADYSNYKLTFLKDGVEIVGIPVSPIGNEPLLFSLPARIQPDALLIGIRCIWTCCLL